MAKYRLKAQHIYRDGRVLDVGTEVGDGTPWQFDEPSTAMEGVDEEGKQRVNELHQKLYAHDADWSVLPEDMKVDEKKLEEERRSEPVSDAQAAERGQEPPTQQGPLPGRGAVPGPATPRQTPVRPSEPNKEQAPKDL